LPPRLLEPARDGDTAGIEIHFDEKTRFYELMELYPVRGFLTPERLDALGLIQEAEYLWPQSKYKSG
jgi:hypothetical protein